MAKIKLDGVEYDLANCSEEAQRLVGTIKETSARIQEINNMIAIMTKAKRAYIADLKSEMLSAKAGFDFSGD